MRVNYKRKNKHIKYHKNYKHNIFIKTKQNIIKSLVYNFISRKKKKLIYKSYFIVKLNFFLNKFNYNYNLFYFYLRILNFSRKILYFIVTFDNKLFLKLLNICY